MKLRDAGGAAKRLAAPAAKCPGIDIIVYRGLLMSTAIIGVNRIKVENNNRGGRHRLIAYHAVSSSQQTIRGAVRRVIREYA